MRFSTATLLTLLSLCQDATALRGGQTNDIIDNSHRSLACPGEDGPFSVTFDGDCDYDGLKDAIEEIKDSSCVEDTNAWLRGLLGAGNEAQAKDKVKELCKQAVTDTTESFPFGEITKKGNQFDNEYYEGGTYFNYEIENNDAEHRLREDASRINRVHNDQAKTKVIPLPSYLKAFDPQQDGCEIDAAFCCWVQDRQANDNNGNCNTPYESQCIDRDPGDNANFCYTDHERSGADVQGGFSVFVNVQNGQENIEGAIHCHGFAWASDPLHDSNIYKGNNLFYVSLYDHMHQRGYVRNAPGSAMCGCSENMAVVSRADCTEIDARQEWTFSYSGNSFSSVLSKVKEVKFNACQGKNNRNNDLEAYYERLVDEGKQTQGNLDKLRKTLVGAQNGKCKAAVESFMASKGIVRSTGANSINSFTVTDDMEAVSDEITPASLAVEAHDPDYDWEKSSNKGPGMEMPDVPVDTASAFMEVGDSPPPKEEKPEPSPPDADAGTPNMSAEEAEKIFEEEENISDFTIDTVEPEDVPIDANLKDIGARCKGSGECESGLCEGGACIEWDIPADDSLASESSGVGVGISANDFSRSSSGTANNSKNSTDWW